MSLRDAIELHAQCLEADADALEEDGVGGHPTQGHVAILRRMASAMRADAAVGRMPHAFHDQSLYAASADPPPLPPALPAAVLATLRGAGIDPAAPITLDAFNAAVRGADTPMSDRLAAKAELHRAGRLN